MGRLKWLGLGLAAAIVLVVAGLVVADQASLPPAPDPAGFIAKAKAYDVRIRRDEWGVPHILGATDPDVAFGFAYAHAEDDFRTLQEAVFTCRGELAAQIGPKGAPTDYLVRLFKVRETIDTRYDRDLSADVRKVLEAYADGVNDYAALHPGQVARGLLPVTGKDIDACFVFRTPFFYGLDHVIKSVTAKAKPGAAPPIGSNGVAMAPSRSVDGATRLLVNSHQPYTGQVAWYEAVLQSGQGWHVAGGFFPGSPFMLHGHNEHLGWANTVNDPNLSTVYRLALNPADPNQYRLDGAWKTFERRDAHLRIRLFGPLVITVTKPLEWSVQGPVFRTDHGVFALRYAGMDEVRQPEQYYRLDKAADWGQWRAAMALQALPSINYIYADQTGRIGYVYNGEFPNRIEGRDWRQVQPGDRSDLIWHGYLPFDRVPQIWSPRSGWVFNSNNTPFAATDPADGLKPADFPASMGLQSNMTNRAFRAQETFGQDHAVTDASFRAHKFDIAYSDRSDLARLIAQLVAIDPGQDGDLKQAQAILRRWDRRTDIHNRGAALAVLTGVAAIKSDDNPNPPPALDALHHAMTALKTRFSRFDPEWGEVNRIRRGKLDLPIDGGPDTFRAVYGAPQRDGTLTAEAGDTFIMFVTWDRAGKVSSQSIHQFGSATQDASSPHYADQTPLFVAMKTKPVLFTEDQLKGHVTADYRPGVR
jgi:penicillin amidase/acyl-homoserine-lactone acylase